LPIRHQNQRRKGLIQEAPPSYIRDPAFRRVVIEAYDFRCAATGWRIILPDSRAMVEAAHIVPFAESQNDDPRNGLALTPSFHWALDAGAIAPGPDFKWHVAKHLDRRFAENKPLCDLEGTSLILPKDRTLWPKEEWLKWRSNQL
jgi:putative restriction endonuclease